MAARSEGIFPREGFNLDNAFQIFPVETDAPVSLANVRSFRVVIAGLQEVPPTGDGATGVFGYEIGGKLYAYTIDDLLAAADNNGTFIAHHRGHGLPSPTSCSYEITPGADNAGTGQSMTFEYIGIELVDGPAR